jgi:GTPase involved in cell partitioning and DNA repair
MKNYLVKELLNEMNEYQLELIDRDTVALLEKIDIYTSIVDAKYEDKLRDKELIDSIKAYNNDIKNLIDRINSIEVDSIKNKNEQLMFTCESKKATLINLMIYLQNKYL